MSCRVSLFVFPPGFAGWREDCPANTRKDCKPLAIFAHRPGRPVAWLTAAAAILVAASCTDQTAIAASPARIASPTIREVPQVTQDTTTTDSARATASITGVRLTEGNAVDCPQIRDDAGVIHPVSYLSPAVAIGARVAVSGFYAITTSCRGTVLVVEEERILQN